MILKKIHCLVGTGQGCECKLVQVKAQRKDERIAHSLIMRALCSTIDVQDSHHYSHYKGLLASEVENVEKLFSLVCADEVPLVNTMELTFHFEPNDFNY